MRLTFLVLLVIGAAALSPPEARGERLEPGWLSPFFGPLAPNAHVTTAAGHSSGDPERLIAGHHDPAREQGTLQGLELGTSLRTDRLQGFATFGIYYGAEEEWETAWEEAFLKVVDLSGGVEIRGGRMLTRFGQQNTRHLHAWDFVDTPLVLGRFLGDDGLIHDGGDLTWVHRGLERTIGATLGYGAAKSHAQEHAEGCDDEGALHEDGLLGEDEHAGEMLFDDGILSGRAFVRIHESDFHVWEVGGSVAGGDDDVVRRLIVYGLDLSYGWRENGLEPGGRALSWITEFLYRDVEDGTPGKGRGEEHVDRDDRGDEALPGTSEGGFYSSLVYTPHDRIDIGVRVDYVEGTGDCDARERFRVSPAATVFLDPWRRTSLRLQYNYDDVREEDVEHTVWVQVSMSWGAPEVR